MVRQAPVQGTAWEEVAPGWDEVSTWAAVAPSAYADHQIETYAFQPSLSQV